MININQMVKLTEETIWLPASKKAEQTLKRLEKLITLTK
jgi:hypothetical protein